MSPYWKSLRAVALAAVLVLAGCSGLAGQDLGEQRERQVADEIEEKLRKLDSFEATVTTQITVGNRTTTAKTRVKADLETGKYWTETLRPETRAGDVTVYNGSTMVFYDASENTVRTFDADMGGVGAGANLSQRFDKLVENADIIYNGTERVDGRKTYEVTLVPENGSKTSAGTLTLWVETDRMIPVKMRTSTSTADTTMTMTVTFTDVELNSEFPDGTFEFDVPANATVTEGPSFETESYGNRSALAGATDHPVPDPDVPDGYSFDEGTVVSGKNVTTVTLRYTNESESLIVSVSEADGDRPEPTGGEPVTVDGHTAHYRTFGEMGSVQWRCGDYRYGVIGHFGKETLTEVASSIEC